MRKKKLYEIFHCVECSLILDQLKIHRVLHQRVIIQEKRFKFWHSMGGEVQFVGKRNSPDIQNICIMTCGSKQLYGQWFRVQ